MGFARFVQRLRTLIGLPMPQPTPCDGHDGTGQGVDQPQTHRLASIELTDVQQILIRVLRETDGQLSTIYESALFVARSETPDKCALAAHQARELMEKLPWAVGCVWTDPRGKADKLTSLMASYASNAKAHNTAFTSTVPATVVPPVLRYLAKSDQTWDWHDKHVKELKANIPGLVSRCHASVAPSPRTMGEFTRKWNGLRSFFTKVSHHGASPSQVELDTGLGELADLLLWLMRPRPVEDFEAIDRLISEVESNGD